MPITDATTRFCLSHAGSFVVPAECLDGSGMDVELRRRLIDEWRVSEDQLRCLETGFGLYWQRCNELFKRAPGAWFPPRQTNLLIAEHADDVLPYLEPFAGTSSLLYRCDLDTHPEYVAALLLHMERLASMRSVRAAVIGNLSYWFDRDADSRRAFAAAAARAQRPDAAAFVALADALVWIDDLMHDPLRAPEREPDEPYVGVNDTGLYVPKRLQGALLELAATAEAAVSKAISAHASAPVKTRANGALDDLCDWLEETRACAIVVAPDGATLWNPQAANATSLRHALEGAEAAAVASVHADLRVIDARTRQFLACVHDRDALPGHCPVLESGGGAYVDAARRAVVYELMQPAFDARRASAPPYHRLLLGARVMHEWGHIAHSADMIRVPNARKAEYVTARALLGERFADIVRRMPARLRDDIDADIAPLARQLGGLDKALARKTLARVGDYLANRLSARLVPTEEMQAYVRANVRHHFDERLGVASELARYAYEIHYLPLADLPFDYFFKTSRFPEYFIASAIVSEADARALFAAAGAVLDCYEFDTGLIALPSAPSE